MHDELNITINSQEGDDYVLEINILPEEYLDGSEGGGYECLHELVKYAENIIKDYISRGEHFCDICELLMIEKIRIT